MAICERCGAWLEPTALDQASTPLCLVCPHCGHREVLVQHPLWWITGSSGSGKSTLMPHLRRTLPEYVVFDGEAIDYWRFNGPPGDYSSLYNQWLKVAHQIALGERPVVFVATAYPHQLDACTFRHYFAPLRYLGLTCTETTQRARLMARPAWRNAGAPEFISRTCAFTRDLERLGASGTIAVHDTTDQTPVESAAAIAAWIRQASRH